ncbi:MAG TPA: lysylphosphatidylglycerol synthase domain-containing protein, partial [Blastocatellia bacterium]|nr:lysylphosphatidylglycerol synthase domain-containing protein [Blastocatellia bacterium]
LAAGFVAVFVMVWLSIRLRSFALARVVRYFTASRVQHRQHDPASKVREFEERIYDFYAKRTGAFFVILGLNLGAHLINIGEVCAILKFMSLPSSVFSGFIIEAATKLINLVFFFIPGRAGVYESGNALVLEGLGLGASAGVALAIVRKLRAFFWAGWGLATLGVVTFRDGRGSRETTEAIHPDGRAEGQRFSG